MDQPFARSRKSQVLKVVLWTGNHILRWQLRHGLGPRAFALLETTDPAVVAALCRRRSVRDVQSGVADPQPTRYSPRATMTAWPPTMTRSIASAATPPRA